MVFEKALNLEATELRLGLPGTNAQESPERHVSPFNSNKRSLPEMNEDSLGSGDKCHRLNGIKGDLETAPPTKAQVVGWPPIRSYRKNCVQAKKIEAEGTGIYVKVSMDGAPYLRKIDLNIYEGYPELLKALEDMFKFQVAGKYSDRGGYNGSEYAPTYEDKDGDWMLVGDVPWDMFINSCKRLRIMKGSEARGLGCTV
ncbi:hypothetical protein K2173_007008 [Erythroxylum novogranatense]|uniref:Auxin-responsive protein n=1 Tax=Erythroxylum novogranatense TaxID=1862640 RepID=A0AAV8SYA4_9ROSI|nr:hypothetical protein K2173_007008 [Erythroxylum novogranatense]